MDKPAILKCVLVSLLFLLAIFSVAADTTTILFSGFETAITDNFTASAGWTRTTGNFFGGTASALLTGSGGSVATLTSNPVDTSNCDSITVKVYTYDHLIDNNDDAMFQIEGPDNTWTTLAEVGTLTEDSWSMSMTYQTNSAYMFNGFQIRFTDLGVLESGETLGVDNVSIECYTDTTPPNITNVASANITSSSARITWTTDENANSSVRYGRTSALSDGFAGNATLAANHSVNLTSLLGGTQYFYNVSSCDENGNCAVSGPYNFTTSAGDSTAPVISSVVNSSITSSSANVAWSTDENSNSSLLYGLSASSLVNAVHNSSLVTSHSMPISSLQPNTTYYYNVSSCDASGNCAVSGPFSFVTLPPPTYNITNVPADTKVRMESDASLNVTGVTGLISVLVGIGSGAGSFAAVVNLNFTQNIDSSGLVANMSRTNAKSVIHNVSGLTGFVSVDLLIPRVSSSGNVFVCPGATSLSQVTSSCAGAVNISVGQAVSGMNVTVVSYEGESYYKVSNVTGTGGGELPTLVNPLQCFFISNNTCPAGSAKLIGMLNDTGGYSNAHAQNSTLNTYNHSICCNDTNASVTINSICPGQETVINLFAEDNAHIQIGNITNYTVSACLSSSWKRVSCYYPAESCDEGYSCVLSMASSEGDNTTNAHLGACEDYGQNVCCALVNTAPSAPVLNYPQNNNYTVFERSPNFNWSASTSSEGNQITYTLNASCESCTCPNIAVSAIAGTNYTAASPLCVDKNYTWSVTACDNYGDCNTSTSFNFSVKSVMYLSLVVNFTDLGSLSPGQTRNTLSGSPSPLIAQNDGNVLLNVTINASSLFSSGLDNSYFMYLGNSNESGSIVAGCSQTAFANMSAAPKNLFCNLSYVDSSDTGRLDFNVTVPVTEGSGQKSSTIELAYDIAGLG